MYMICANILADGKYLKLQKKNSSVERADFTGITKNTPRLRLRRVVSTVTFKGGDKI